MAQLDGGCRILLVDDNPGDIMLTRIAFEEARITNDICAVENGEEALAFLRREGKFIDAPRPNLILLDWNMPRMGGSEVLAELKADPDLDEIPVVVLTTSDAEADVLQAYEQRANCYLTKPVAVEDFIHKVRALESFWFTVVRLPDDAA